MKSPKDMRIIEIDITNACDKRCSNCTRLCGHHQKPFFMDFDTFRRAVDSLDGYRGIRSLMGGEPTLHPEFERFIRYLGSKFPARKNPLVWPQKEFIRQIHRVELANFVPIGDGTERMDVVGAGMFSNMGASYRKHYEIISDMLPFQGLNDHLNPIYHQSALITREELGVPDTEWVKLRDACWLQNEWSAGITPKGAFFCEMAGVLDMLLDGPGGWPIEPGWWKRTPQDFGDQLHWCELCGFPLRTFTRDSAEETDDMSPVWYARLKALKSPKLASGKYHVVNIQNGKIPENDKRDTRFFSAAMPYIEHYEERFNASNSVLFTREYASAVIPDGNGFGAALNRLLASAHDWIVLYSQNALLTDDFRERIGRYVLNPGTLHYLDLSLSDDIAFVKNADTEKDGYAALFSKNALSLREFGFDRIAHTRSFREIRDMWHSEKVVELSSKIDRAMNLCPVYRGMRFAVWGTGSAGSVANDLITNAEGKIVLALDKDTKKHGCDFYGVTIQPPEVLRDNAVPFDALVVANYSRFGEIKAEAISFGVSEASVWHIRRLCDALPPSEA